MIATTNGRVLLLQCKNCIHAADRKHNRRISIYSSCISRTLQRHVLAFLCHSHCKQSAGLQNLGHLPESRGKGGREGGREGGGGDKGRREGGGVHY